MRRLRILPFFKSIMIAEINTYLCKFYPAEKIHMPVDWAGVSAWFFNEMMSNPIGSHKRRASKSVLQKIVQTSIKIKDIRFLQRVTANDDVDTVGQLFNISAREFYSACRRNWREGVHFFSNFANHERHNRACLCPTELGGYCGRNEDDCSALELCNHWESCDKETVYMHAVVEGIKSAGINAIGSALIKMGKSPDIHNVHIIVQEWLRDEELVLEHSHDEVRQIRKNITYVLNHYEGEKEAERKLVGEVLSMHFSSPDVCTFVTGFL